MGSRTRAGVRNGAARDSVDRILEQWARERPELDATPMAVIVRMSRLSRILDRRIEAVLAQHGFNESQFGVLAALRRAGPPYCLSPTALYNSLLISSGAMTNRLDRLTRAGLVKRVPDPKDRRSVLVMLTLKGQRAVERAVSAQTEIQRALLAGLGKVERETLARLLRKLLIGLGDGMRLETPVDSVPDPR